MRYSNFYTDRKQKSALVFVLKGLIPYTRENLMLAFKPNQFINELEKISRYKRQALERAFRRAEQQELFRRRANVVVLTEAGKKIIRPFIAKQLPKGEALMVTFDIPEDMAVARARLRRILKQWHFDQIQKSVWIAKYDHRDSIKDIVLEMDLAEYVELFECSRINLR